MAAPQRDFGKGITATAKGQRYRSEEPRTQRISRRTQKPLMERRPARYLMNRSSLSCSARRSLVLVAGSSSSMASTWAMNARPSTSSMRMSSTLRSGPRVSEIQLHLSAEAPQPLHARAQQTADEPFGFLPQPFRGHNRFPRPRGNIVPRVLSGEIGHLGAEPPHGIVDERIGVDPRLPDEFP